MKRNLLSILNVFFFIARASAQNFTGTVQMGDGQPIVGAVIRLYTAKADTLNATVTAADGSFKINRGNLAAYALVTHIGYLPYQITNLADAAAIILQAENRTLTGVTVKANKPFIENRFDRMIVNVDGDPRAGISAADVLKKVPGLAVSETGLMLEGKGVTVYLDGKLTRLPEKELMALLSHTPTGSISKIEVMASPSAKFDAQGNGGIINIQTRRRSKPGYDANVGLTAGHGWKYFSYNSAYAGLNFRSGNNYVYGSYSGGLGKQSQELQTTTFLNTGQNLLDSTRYKTPYRDQNLRLGWDHYLNSKNVMGVLILAYNGQSDPDVLSRTGAYQASRLDSVRQAAQLANRQSIGINLNLNFKLKLDSVKQQELTMDADAGVFRYQNTNRISLQTTNTAAQTQQLIQLAKAKTQIYSYKADYAQRLGNGNLEAGVKAARIDVDNNFLAQGTGGASSELVNAGSNQFKYRETLLASYGSYRHNWGKFTLQTGLRAEQTWTRGNSITLDTIFNRSYLSLFPNITAGYKWKTGQISAAYSRRIGRPAYNYLNPFRIVRGAYAVYEGNPGLRPSFTDGYRLNYILKRRWNFTLTYSKVNDVITDLALLNAQTRITTSLKANLEYNKNAGLYVNYSGTFWKNLEVNYTLGSAYNCYQFYYSDQPFTIKQLTNFSYIDNQLNLPKNWWIDVYTYAQSRVTYGNQINLPLTTTQISAGKKLWKEKGSISLSVNDIFFTGVQRSQANYGDLHTQISSRYDSRNFRLNLSYNFGNCKVDVRRRGSGAAEEQRRSQ